MNSHIQANFKANAKVFAEEINDPNAYIDKDLNCFKDDNFEIHPLMLSGKYSQQQRLIHPSSTFGNDIPTLSDDTVSYVMIAKKLPGKVLKEKLVDLKIKGKMVMELLEKGSI